MNLSYLPQNYADSVMNSEGWPAKWDIYLTLGYNEECPEDSAELIVSV